MSAIADEDPWIVRLQAARRQNQAMKTHLTDEVAQRDWVPREWQTGEQAENAESRKTWELLDPDADSLLTRAVVDGLLG